MSDLGADLLYTSIAIFITLWFYFKIYGAPKWWLQICSFCGRVNLYLQLSIFKNTYHKITTHKTSATANNIKDDLDDLDEYRIVGTTYRDINPSDIGESDRFILIADTNNKYDKYAVKVLNHKYTHVGYLSESENKLWYKLLIKMNANNPIMKCHGIIGQFEGDDGELLYYGKVFLPSVEQDEDYFNLLKNR